MRLVQFLLILIPLAVSSPIHEQGRKRSEPTVTIRNGSIIARTVQEVESFNGIPYAQPPTGELRLRPPQTLNSSFGIFESQLLPAGCPQFWSNLDGSNLPEEVAGMVTNSPIFKKVTVQSEDCLTLNVQRPAGVDATANLPVVVWIFGGAFATGASHIYDGTRILKQSVAMEQPIIFVAINYRLGGFGFLPGKEVSAEGSSNLGLRDQRMALKWIQENIAEFGGDPEKVVLWGESAGAISILDQTIIEGGDNSYNGGSLFRGAIMNSGSTTPTLPVDHAKAQAIYDAVVSTAGCSQANDSLSCLRSLPFDKISDAFASVPSFFSYTSVDLSYLPRPDITGTFFSDSPEVAVRNGKFARIPIISGDQGDEGTIFSLTQSNLSTPENIVDYFKPMFPRATGNQVSGLVSTYPDDTVTDSLWGFVVYPQFLRLAALLGDLCFTFQRRAYLDVVAADIPVWSYTANYLALTPGLGTFHASDTLATFFDLPYVPTMPSILTYYISFIAHLDPNRIPNTEFWPQYTLEDKQLLEFGATGHEVATDNARDESFSYFRSNQEVYRI